MLDAALTICGAGESSKPRVTTPAGRIEGRGRETPRDKAEFVSFTRIPYAQPPTGRLRFLRPVPLEEPWPGPVKANRKCSTPMQINKFLGHRLVGQEDCLHLNVYTQDLPVTENQSRIPVMVWLFGGEFVMGDASEDMHFPEQIMEDAVNQVVLVTVNYRVGPFGFLSLGSEEVAGNQFWSLKYLDFYWNCSFWEPHLVTLANLALMLHMRSNRLSFRWSVVILAWWILEHLILVALRLQNVLRFLSLFTFLSRALWDQNLALRWVQRHISSFGGDPDRVTLVGEGSGAVCVSCHMVSPHSAGLFHRAICMSGSLATPAFTHDKPASTVGLVFAAKLGCSRDSSDPGQILSGLQEKSASEVCRASTFLRDWDAFTPRAWLPDYADRAHFSDPGRAFFPDHPLDLIARGDYNRMPVIIGGTKDEGIYYAATFLKDPSVWSLFDSHWRLLTNMLLLNRCADEYDEETDGKLADKIRDFYLLKEEDNAEIDNGGGGGGGDMAAILKDVSGEPRGATFTEEKQEKIVQMFGDAFCLGGNEYLCQLLRASSAQPIYSYSFDYNGGWRFGDLATSPAKNLLQKLLLGKMGVRGKSAAPGAGVSHWDDHFYLFSPSLPFLKSDATTPTEVDRAVSRALVRLWTNFARTSNPTPNPEDALLRRLVWEVEFDRGGKVDLEAAAATSEARRFLRIDSTPKMAEFDEDRRLRAAFWTKVIDEVRKRKSSRRPPQLHDKTRIEMMNR